MFRVIGLIGLFLLLFGGILGGEAEGSKKNKERLFLISAILMSAGLFLGLGSILFLRKGF